MMIRINLLPVRQVKKREMGRQVLVLFGGLLVLTLVGNFLWWRSYQSSADEKVSAVRQMEDSIKQLEKVIGEVNNVNKRKKEVQDKLKILETLRKGRSGPVRMLDALATSTPKNVTLKDFEEKSGEVVMNGVAMSHEDVAEFIRSLGNMVWTPKGMGRLIEQKRDAKSARIEVLSSATADSTIEDFQAAEYGKFFNNIELKKAEQKETKEVSGLMTKRVDFQVTLRANYAL